ncbi:MAG TPA: hypothetical protein PLQ19_01780 [Aeromicrobium sp.]|nr:hypothetical protein [Aeromicrobium sp.]
MTDTPTGAETSVPESITSQVSDLLTSLEQVEVAEHPSVYESIDRLLRDRLSARPGVDQ